MIPLLAISIATFIYAWRAGYTQAESHIWKYVDVIYYPLAAIGIVLLFVNSSAQRQLIELNQLEEDHRSRLVTLSERKPQVNVAATSELIDSSVALVATISGYATACKHIPELEPRCEVASKLKQPVDTFLQSARIHSDLSLAQRLSYTCVAADKMLDDIQSVGGISPTTNRELMTQYVGAIIGSSMNYDMENINSRMNTFDVRSRAHIEALRHLLNDDSDAAKFVINMRLYEIEFGKVLLQGLMPCITAPRKDLDALTDWTKTRQTEEEQLTQLEIEKQNIKNAAPAFPKLALIHLWIWPYILIFALALKFAKGVADIAKHRKAYSVARNSD